MSNTATQTYQEGVQNLQSWLDFLSAEEEKLGAQLAKMQGGNTSLPEIDADVPYMEEEDLSAPLPSPDDDAEDVDKWA
jgi:hypothetical protein